MPVEDQEDSNDPEADDIEAMQDGKDGDLVSLLPHYYRGEVSRTTNALDRIDKTTNWAITLIAALLTVVFASREMPARLLLLGFVILAMFLLFEVRRYRFYDLYRARVRLIQENLFANALDPEGEVGTGWREDLAQDLRVQVFKVGPGEALARRINRIYGFLFSLVAIAWFGKVFFYSSTGWEEAASLFGVPGAVIAGAVLALVLTLIVFARWPREREAKGEVQDVEPGKWKDQ